MAPEEELQSMEVAEPYGIKPNVIRSKREVEQNSAEEPTSNNASSLLPAALMDGLSQLAQGNPAGLLQAIAITPKEARHLRSLVTGGSVWAAQQYLGKFIGETLAAVAAAYLTSKLGQRFIQADKPKINENRGFSDGQN